MFQESIQDATAPTNQPIPLPERPQETVNHILMGSLTGIHYTIKLLHKLSYAEPNDWSKPLPTGRPNEMMAILTKRIPMD